MTIVFSLMMLAGFICSIFVLCSLSPRAKWSDLTDKQWWLVKGLAMTPIGIIGLIIVGVLK